MQNCDANLLAFWQMASSINDNIKTLPHSSHGNIHAPKKHAQCEYNTLHEVESFFLVFKFAFNISNLQYIYYSLKNKDTELQSMINY